VAPQRHARDTGLDRDGWIKADQLFTFPCAELGGRVGRLSVERLEELDQALRFVLDL
jgi:mRNA-degrading endonuclease toxin of MazEF toxin-antitoxin module